MTTVYLVGSLGKAVNHPVWHLEVSSVAEAVRAININTKGALERYLGGPAKARMYKIALQKKTNVVDPQEMTHKSGLSAIYIIPTIKGRNSGAGKIVAGVVILALAYFTGGLSAGATGWAGAGATATTSTSLSFLGTIAVGFGVSLVLGGISQLLTPTVKPGTQGEQKNSTFFQGNATTVVQGGCVPLVYGRALVSPIPVAITVDNDDLSTTSAGTQGTVTQTNLPGGGIQYGSEAE